MEEFLNIAASWGALALEAVAAMLVVYGAMEALVRMARLPFNQSDPVMRRRIWMNFAQWIILALEFALGADIIRTAIAPTWDDIGKLAAIAAIRTGLSFFLERDIETFGPGEEKKAKTRGSAE